MTRIYGFPPVAGEQSKALVLGSMPGVASLERYQYYAKPQNAFWRIMGALFDAGPELHYAERVNRLADAGVAVWDVLGSCVRPGSLDSNIRMSSVEVNDLPGLLYGCPGIQYVFFNGRKAEQLYYRRVLPEVQAVNSGLIYFSMPSTSPAMASLTFEMKLERWQTLKDVLSPAA